MVTFVELIISTGSFGTCLNMYNALCCSIFTPDLDVSGGVPGAKSGTAQAVPVVSPPTPLQKSTSTPHVIIHRLSTKFSKALDIFMTHSLDACTMSPTYNYTWQIEMSWAILSSAYSAAHLNTVHNVAMALQDGFRIYEGLILLYE